MQQVISYFNETLNDINTYEQIQLYEATHEVDVDSVRFLLQQEGILLDKLSRRRFNMIFVNDTIAVVFGGDGNSDIHRFCSHLFWRGFNVVVVVVRDTFLDGRRCHSRWRLLGVVSHRRRRCFSSIIFVSIVVDAFVV